MMIYNELKHKIIKLAISHGIIIKELDLNENEPNALIIKNYIGIKKQVQKREWNYLILHEMGHYFMHMGKSISWNHTIIKDKYELEADAFACRKILEFSNVSGSIKTILLANGVPTNVIKNFLF